MKSLQKLGGVSSFIMAIAYLIGISLAFTVLDTSNLTDPVSIVRFHVEYHMVFYIWITLIYIVPGVFLVSLSLALYEKLTEADPERKLFVMLATVFGLIWATLIMGSGLLHNTGLMETVRLYSENAGDAAFFWRTIETVHAGIGASIEIPGGIWSILIGAVALRTGVFPKALNWLAIAAGIAGILSIVPLIIDIVTPIYALGQIAWWIWLGVALLKGAK